MRPISLTQVGSGIPTLFIHAFPLHAGMWRHQMDDASGRMNIAFDVPGAGRGGPALPDFSMDIAADMCAAALDACGVERAVWCGCSMGGYIALAGVRRHADRILGLVLTDTRAGEDTPEGKATRSAQAEQVLRDGPDAVIEGLLPKLIAPSSVERLPALPGELRTMMRMASPEGIASMLRAMRDRPDSFEDLRRAAFPVCVIVGEHDVLTPPAEAERMAEAARDAELRVIADAGHLANLEQPEEFNRILDAFLSRIV